MKPILTAFLAALLCPASLFSETPQSPAANVPPIPRAPSPSLAPIKDETGLPRVLLIGDSISIGKEHGIAINDLNAHITPQLDTLQKPRDVHSTTEGSAYLGQQVAQALNQALAK